MRKTYWMLLLIYVVKAPSHPRAGPRDPPPGLRAWSWMTAALIFEIVVPAFAASTVRCHLLRCPELSELGAPLQAGTEPLGCAEPPCCRRLPSVPESQVALSLSCYPFGQTWRPWWHTPWPAAEPLRHPGLTRGWGGVTALSCHLWGHHRS